MSSNSLFNNLNKSNIGLLGGSFDPAHLGHLYISNKIINILGLTQLWWLVTSQNPLKKKNQFTNLNKRLLSTFLINNNYKIRPQALELKIGTIFTYHTIRKLKTIMPRVNFYWIMGADNLCDMHNWYNWKKIFYMCPIIIVNRKGYLYKSLHSKVSSSFRNNRFNIRQIKNKKSLPAWSFLNIKPDPNSSTNLRQNIG